MIVLMLASFLVQATTGLFSDDEIATQGPLAVKVSNGTVSRMSAIHSWWEWAIVALVVLHVAAIAAYRWKWNVRLAAAMLHGWMEGAAGAAAPRLRSTWLAAALLAASAAAVYVLVEIVPMR